jgi:arylsulfatase A-like enzyme
MAAYDESIAALDAEVGRLLDTLASRGGLEHTLVIVTSDHGEEFGEHGQLSHGRNLFIGTLHVPLVVVWPGRVPVGSVAAPVSLRDLPATVLDLAVPGGPALPGRSLRRAWQGAGGDLAPPLSMLRGSVSVVDGRYHYVAAGDGAESVYDWWDDPSEQHDLVAGPSVQRDLPRWRGLVPAAARGERTR